MASKLGRYYRSEKMSEVALQLKLDISEVIKRLQRTVGSRVGDIHAQLAVCQRGRESERS